MLLIIFIYLTALFIAPQLWIEPFVDMRVDFFIYPAWFAMVLLSGRFSGFKWSAQDVFFLLFVTWVIVSIVVNGSHERSSTIIQNYIKWFLLYKLVIWSVQDIDGVRKVINLILFFALVLVVEGIQHKTSSDGIGWAGQSLGWVDASVLREGGTGRTQWINIFDGPGVFCVVYTTALPFILRYFREPYSTFQKLLALGMLAAMGLAIFYTGSRGGFIATLAIFALFLMFRFRKRFAPTRLAVVGGIIFVLFILAPAYLTNIHDEQGSAQYRVAMWVEGVEMVQQNPVFGIGSGRFLEYTSRLIAHNSAIEIMGELGLPGLFFWISMIYMAFRGIYEFVNNTDDPVAKSNASMLAISIAGYLVSSMFVTLEYETFYFLLALAAVLGHASGVELKFEKKDFYRVGTIMGVWLVTLKLFVMSYI